LNYYKVKIGKRTEKVVFSDLDIETYRKTLEELFGKNDVSVKEMDLKMESLTCEICGKGKEVEYAYKDKGYCKDCLINELENERKIVSETITNYWIKEQDYTFSLTEDELQDFDFSSLNGIEKI
jgi:hypothetical protein